MKKDNINAIILRIISGAPLVIDTGDILNQVEAVTSIDDFTKEYLYEAYIKSRIISVLNNNGYYSVADGKYVNAFNCDNPDVLKAMWNSGVIKDENAKAFIKRIKDAGTANCPGQTVWKFDDDGNPLQVETEKSKDELIEVLKDLQKEA